MNFAIHLEPLLNMIAQLQGKAAGRQRADRYLRLSACDGMVFVAANEGVCGVEALVLKDGACSLPRVKFAKVLMTYVPKEVISIDANSDGLSIGGFRMKVRNYSEKVISPTNFERFALANRLEWGGYGRLVL